MQLTDEQKLLLGIAVLLALAIVVAAFVLRAG